MATIADVQAILGDSFGLTVEEPRDSVFPVRHRAGIVQLGDVDVETYLATRSGMVSEPNTSVFAPRYYEHLVDVQSVPLTSMRLFPRDENRLSVRSSDGALTVELSDMSTLFLLWQFERNQSREFRRRFRSSRGGSPRSEAGGTSLQRLFVAVRTVKVIASDAYPNANSRMALKRVAEAVLFNISFSRGVGLSLSSSWERSSYRLVGRRSAEINFPQRSYNPNLVAYYNLALSSESLILAYLSLYKILEYFFLSTAETTLHRRLRDKLAAPDFNLRNQGQLRQVAALIRKHDQRMDEQKMLAGVISHYFMPDEINGWLDEDEDRREYFTTLAQVFGKSETLDLNPSQYAGSLAGRIYHIRNTLVHNKEGELPRFIPFSGQEEVLYHELPLMLYLAEQLIVKTGEDL
jgi:hypothetical protein